MRYCGKLQGLFAAAVAVLGLSGPPALAHHSFAMFDRQKPLVLDGKVREFQWTNPHVWIEMIVVDGRDGASEWGVECTSVNMLKRQGWHHDSLHPGDRVKLLLYPLRDGSHGGQLAKLLEINGSPANLVSYR
jgi:Family of unknown function (DUF6152)